MSFRCSGEVVLERCCRDFCDSKKTGYRGEAVSSTENDGEIWCTEIEKDSQL